MWLSVLISDSDIGVFLITKVKITSGRKEEPSGRCFTISGSIDVGLLLVYIIFDVEDKK